MPPALYEIGSALVVAVTVLPQLADSVRRVRAAQTLRGGDTGRVRGLRRLLVPVLEDALERSLALAAGMDTRGYGRTSGATPRERRTTGGLMLLGLVRDLRRGVRRPRPARRRPGSAGRCWWSACVVSRRRPSGSPGAGSGGRRYRPDPVAAGPSWSSRPPGCWSAPAGWWMSRHQLTIAYPSLTVAPTLSLLGARGRRRRAWPAPCARRTARRTSAGGVA